MNAIALLKQQTLSAHNWTHKLIKDIPLDRWEDIPEGSITNVSWQIGHLIISEHYNNVLSIRGKIPVIFEKIPLRTYVGLFTMGTQGSQIVGEIKPSVLLENLNFIQDQSLQSIEGLSVDSLNEPIVPTKRDHPIANTKVGVLSWNVQHILWHCGQLASLKRALLNRPSFSSKPQVNKS